MRRLCEFGIWYALIAQRLTPFIEISINHFLGRVELGLRFLAAPQPREQLATHEMHALAVGGQAHRRINRRKRVMLTGTTLGTEFVIRICVVSHRTHMDRMQMCIEDIKAAVGELAELGSGL